MEKQDEQKSNKMKTKVEGSDKREIKYRERKDKSEVEEGQ